MIIVFHDLKHTCRVLESWLNSHKDILLVLEDVVQAQPPTAGSLLLSATPEGSGASALHGHLHSCTQAHIQTHTHTHQVLFKN